MQKSFDSLKFFRTIFSPLSPGLPENGFIDNKPGGSPVYYRIFYVLQDGLYFFSKSKQPSTGFDATEELLNEEHSDLVITITMEDSVLGNLPYSQFKLFRDSIVTNTKDSLFVVGPNSVLLKKFDSSNFWLPSPYVFTNSDGYVHIILPEAEKKHYSLKIFDNRGKMLFNIHRISEPFLMMDKTNFMHAGWFKFELFENDKLKERNKFYLQKDF